MCGRYELHSHPAAIALAFGLAHVPEVAPRYNIAPMTDVPIVRVNVAGERELVQVRWGLVPRRATDPSIGNKLINARGETIATKPSFRTAYRLHRCLIPADGFYEWQQVGSPRGGRKQPMLVTVKGEKPFGFAGLYERWMSPDGDVLDTCTIITTDANALLREVHERMPVIVAPAQYGRWLDPANADVADLIAPYPSEAMTFWPVSARVGNVRNEDAALIERVAIDAPATDIEPATNAPAGKKPPAQSRLF